MGVRPHRNTERPCQTKVGQLEVIILVDKEILRLEVTMKNAVGMAVE